MHAECARQLCADDAVAVCVIDPSSTTVLLLGVDARVVGAPLCRRHAERLTAPSGWQLRDERDIRPDAPSVATDPAATVDPPGRGELDALLDARSPLLSRAFRTARPSG